jgi:hypothetical protein
MMRWSGGKANTIIVKQTYKTEFHFVLLFADLMVLLVLPGEGAVEKKKIDDTGFRRSTFVGSGKPAPAEH